VARSLILIACLLALVAAGAEPARSAARGPQTEIIVTLASPPLARASGQAAAERLAAEQTRFARGLARTIPGASVHWRYRIVANGFAVVVPSKAVPLVRRLPGVRAVYSAARYATSLDRSVAQIHAPQLWGAGLENVGAGLKIGIIDDGVDQRHPFFDPAGYTMPAGFPKGQRAFTTAKVIVARAFPPRGATWKYASRPFDPELSGHATHVAGIAAGNPNTATSESVRVSGVAPRAYIGNYKALTTPTDADLGLNGNSPELVAAIEAAVADGMDVINLSIGEPEIEPSRDIVALALDAAADAGVVPVVAAGNDFAEFGLGSLASPGSSQKAITVGAVETGRNGNEGSLATFSSAGPTPISLRLKPDVSAPGVGILSSAPNGWSRISGTSMATPHVSGAAALLRARHPSWTVSQVKAALVATATPAFAGPARVAPAAPTRAGAGVIDVVRADQPLVLTAPSSLSFGLLRPGVTASASVDIADAGGGAGAWSASVELRGTGRGASVSVPATVNVPGRLDVAVAVDPAAVDGEVGGTIVLARDGERRIIPFWLGIATPALSGHTPTPLAKPGIYRGSTAGRSSLVDAYRYPDRGPESAVTSRLAGPEHVFRVRISRRVANFGVVVLSRQRGSVVEPRTIVAGDEDRQVGYTSLPLNLNPYLAQFGDPVPASGALEPAPGLYDIVFDSPEQARAGRFTFRFWIDDTSPPALGPVARTVRRGSRELTVRAVDAGSGIDPRSLVARVDGGRREARIVGQTIRVSVGGLRRGRHRLRLQVSDYQETRNMENVRRILPNTRVRTATFVIR
jgi:subtilisin family serine protease